MADQANAFDYIRDWRRQFEDGGWWHSFELPDGRRIEGVSKLESQKFRIAQFGLPEDLRGRRVLDVGAWDGWFSFEMERRGAEVVAIDCWDNPRFHEIRERLGSHVEYSRLDVYDLSPNRLGRFDIVLFMGVLYHLKHPLLALERVCAMATEMVAVESFVLRERHLAAGIEEHALMEYFEHDEFGGQFDNWVAPTVPCLLSLCRIAGFARAELRTVHDYGAAVSCHRHWEPVPAEAPPGPRLVGVSHTGNFGINFQSRADEYLSAYIPLPQPQPPREDWRPEVAGYGVPPSMVKPVGDGSLQVSFKLPPGLTPGWHPVRLRTAASGFGNSIEIAVDVPLEPGPLAIRGISDPADWHIGDVSLAHGAVTLWVDGLPRNADVANVSVYIAGRRQRVIFVGEGQVNATLQGIEPGMHDVRVSCGGSVSPAVPLSVLA